MLQQKLQATRAGLRPAQPAVTRSEIKRHPANMQSLDSGSRGCRSRPEAGSGRFAVAESVSNRCLIGGCIHAGCKARDALLNLFVRDAGECKAREFVSLPVDKERAAGDEAHLLL